MSRTQQERHIQLSTTREWVPMGDAKKAALSVYDEFALNLATAEDLMRLSYGIRTGIDEAVGSVIKDDLVERLTHREYFEELLGPLATRMTIKAHLAANMVVPEIQGGLIYGYVQEPFVGHTLLPTLHRLSQQKASRDTKDLRTLREQTYDSLDNHSI